MTRERLKAILHEKNTDFHTYCRDGWRYFEEFIPAIEGYFSYAEAIAFQAERDESFEKQKADLEVSLTEMAKTRFESIKNSAKKAQESKKKR